MLNLYKIRKWAAFLLVAFSSTTSFYIGLKFYNFLWALGLMLITTCVFVLLANILIKTPFRDMVEGKGILTLNFDSTGIFKFGIVGLQSPYIRGRINRSNIEDVWDRSAVWQIEAPQGKVGTAYKIRKGDKAGGIRIDLSEKDYNDGRFALFHWPVLVWNDQIKSLVTKAWLSSNEKETFAEHGILYLNRKMEELTGHMRDFARHVVESTKPKQSLLQNKWVWIIVAVLIIALIALFIPGLMNSFGQVWESAGSIANNNPIVPR